MLPSALEAAPQPPGPRPHAHVAIPDDRAGKDESGAAVEAQTSQDFMWNFPRWHMWCGICHVQKPCCVSLEVTT